jgi:hypothetical protein
MKSRAVMAFALWLGLTAGHAQFNPGGPQTGLNAAMMKLFGDIEAFSSQANVRMVDSSGADTMSLPITMALLDGKVRAEIDLAQVKSKEMSAEVAGSLKQMGMDKMVTIMRPDRKTMLYLYPSLQAYVETPISREDAAQLQGKSSVKTAKLGEESIDGHPCEKNKVTVTDENQRKTEAIVWNARDLKKFPIQMQIDQPDAKVIMRYSQVQLARPDAKQFEAPNGFKKYDSVEKLMQESMTKLLGK